MDGGAVGGAVGVQLGYSGGAVGVQWLFHSRRLIWCMGYHHNHCVRPGTVIRRQHLDPDFDAGCLVQPSDVDQVPLGVDPISTKGISIVCLSRPSWSSQNQSHNVSKQVSNERLMQIDANEMRCVAVIYVLE
jgi:hypothetical protein